MWNVFEGIDETNRHVGQKTETEKYKIKLTGIVAITSAGLLF